jgi:hypothetical protein
VRPPPGQLADWSGTAFRSCISLFRASGREEKNRVGEGGVWTPRKKLAMTRSVGVLGLEPRAGDPLEVEDAVRPEVKGGFAAFDGEGSRASPGDGTLAE